MLIMPIIRVLALARGTARLTPGVLGTQHDPVLTQGLAWHRIDPGVDRFIRHNHSRGLGGPQHLISGLGSQPSGDLAGRARARHVSKHPDPQHRTGINRAGLGTCLRRWAAPSALTG